MLCFQCRRAAASLARRGSAAMRNGVVIRSASQFQSASLRTSLSRDNRPSNVLRYSTASSNTAPTTATPDADADAATPEKPDYLDDAESAIWDKLVAEFAPTELAVQDISGGCGSMYGIEITSEKFRGANMLKQQRMVNAVLGDEMKGWHGVQLRTKVPVP
ncbi:bola-like protein [Xylariaceae sp. FL0594]|nr:bola-like protein [Xylariaceae sp. FL0594]